VRHLGSPDSSKEVYLQQWSWVSVTVPFEYVKPVVNDDLNYRLASMKEQVLSRSRLEPETQSLSRAT
jgi:hypothetical protein